MVYGQTIHYVPDRNYLNQRFAPFHDTCEFLFYEDVQSLMGLTGFENSVAFDDDGYTPTKAVYVAKNGTEIIGIAGAAESTVNSLWEICVDVVEEYRKAKLGTYLVSQLAKRLLERNIVPFYSASVTNIASQMVASRCGYIPAWVDTYDTTLAGSAVCDDSVYMLL